MSTVRIPAADVRVGEDLVFLGRAHRVARIEPMSCHEGCRKAVSPEPDGYDWSFALMAGDQVEVLVPRVDENMARAAWGDR